MKMNYLKNYVISLTAYFLVISYFLSSGYADNKNVQDILQKIVALNNKLSVEQNLLDDPETISVITEFLEHNSDYKVLENYEKDVLNKCPLLKKACPELKAGFFSFNQPDNLTIVILTCRKNDANNWQIILKKNKKSVCKINSFIEKNCCGTDACRDCYKAHEETKRLVKLVALGLSISASRRKELITQVWKKIKKLDTSWDKYTKSSRSQTLIELWMNSHNHSDEYFMPPPEWQWIFFHPVCVFEYIDNSAFDGEQGDTGWGLEIIGFDYWGQGERKFYKPSGFSGILTYVDRAEVNDWGYGCMIHFKHLFSIGYARHDKEDAFLINLDVWKLIDSQKQKYFDYKKKWDKFEEILGLN